MNEIDGERGERGQEWVYYSEVPRVFIINCNELICRVMTVYDQKIAWVDEYVSYG